MKDYESYFFAGGVILTLAGIFCTPVLTVPILHSEGVVTWVCVVLASYLCTYAFSVGISVWNERMYNIAKVKKSMLTIAVVGAIPLVIGLVKVFVTIDLWNIFLIVGCIMFFGPFIIAAICGLIRYVSDKIWVYRMC